MKISELLVLVLNVFFLASPPLTSADETSAEVPVQYLIKFKEAVSTTEAEDQLVKSGFTLNRYIDEIAVYVAVPNNLDEEDATVRKLKESGTVLYAEKDEKRWHTFELAQPTDPLYAQQYALKQIAAEGAWDTTTGSRNVLVAVSDTGVSLTHPDLKTTIWTNSGEIADNGIDDDGNGRIDDVHGWDFVGNDRDPSDENGHGSHVSGIIGAEANNGVGIAGVNWNVTIMPVRFLDKNGGGTDSGGVETILYATKMGARLINASWGSSSGSSALQDAVNYAFAHGTVLVAAAGNSSSNNDTTPGYPAQYAPLAIAASDSSSNPASFTSYGRTTVDLAAPGVGVLSCYLNDGWKSLSGTSMATPVVTGVAALILSVAPQLSTTELRNAVLNAVTPRAGFSGKVATAGVVNALTAITQLSAGFQVWPATFTVAANSKFQFTGYDGSGQVSWSVSDPAIATISAAGELTGLKSGTVTISAKDETGAQATTASVQVVGGATPPPGGGCARARNRASSPLQTAANVFNMSLPLLAGFIMRRKL